MYSGERFGTRPRHLKGLRAVASIEFSKGVLVLLAGFGLLSLMHKDVWEVADNLLLLLRINPDHRYAQVFLDWAERVTDRNLMMAASGAATYSMLRFVEAYGLWRARLWAEWFAFLSGTVYLPFEVYELMRKFTALRVAVLLINLVVVLYMLYLLLERRAQKRLQQTQ